MAETRKKLFIYLLLVFIFTINSVNAQNTKNIYRMEIGAGLAIPPGSTTIDPSIAVKYAIKRDVFRAGFFYSKELYNSAVDYSYAANLGYERRFFGPKLQMLTGVDVGFSKMHYDRKQHFPYWRHIVRLGAGPVIGGIYNIHERFSLQTELGFFYGAGLEKVEEDQEVYGVEYGYTIHRFFSLHLYYNFLERKSN